MIIFIISLNLVACSDEGKKRYEAEFLFLFDTTTQIIGYTDNKEEFSEYAQLIYDELEEYHQLYDIYNDYDGINNIKTINDNAGIAPITVDRRIIDLLFFAKESYDKTEGKVNVAFGSVLEIWHDYRTRGTEDYINAELPPMEILEKAAEHIDIKDIIIDENNSTVYLSDPEMSLDVGAIAKGYAVECVSEIVKEEGFTSGLLSVGGNVRAIGYKGEDNNLWNIGIKNPDTDSEEGDLYKMRLSDLSLVTSGDYLRYYTVEGKEYHHIIDPETLFPSDYYAAVTVICEDSGISDALSTALYNMPIDQGMRLVESLQDTEALWVYHSGDKEFSSGFLNYTKLAI